VKLIEKRADEPSSSSKTQQLINQNVDIKIPTKNSSRIDSVIDEVSRHEQVFLWKA
jgi:hypothetical protein